MNLRVGRWLDFLAPGYGRCHRCKTPWKFVQEHTTSYCPHDDACLMAYYRVDDPAQIPREDRCSGVMALCEKCWMELTPETRLPYYLAVIERWTNEPGTEDAVIAAVAAGR